mmetsp:Transcript_124539/g.346736  ORF Transcript_124539/g.346736 Transcript_124539/m.346736 type:complete len:281 (+) Transcript_124539:351-1193(+)
MRASPQRHSSPRGAPREQPSQRPAGGSPRAPQCPWDSAHHRAPAGASGSTHGAGQILWPWPSISDQRRVLWGTLDPHRQAAGLLEAPACGCRLGASGSRPPASTQSKSQLQCSWGYSATLSLQQGNRLCRDPRPAVQAHGAAPPASPPPPSTASVVPRRRASLQAGWGATDSSGTSHPQSRLLGTWRSLPPLACRPLQAQGELRAAHPKIWRTIAQPRLPGWSPCTSPRAPLGAAAPQPDVLPHSMTRACLRNQDHSSAAASVPELPPCCPLQSCETSRQ